MMLAIIDPWILAFSFVTVAATVFMGFWSAKKSKTAGDFFVAGRSVSVGWNASAISGEYLSAASFMGVAGMVMSSGYDALWYPVCYACGYLFLLLFIAGPLRRFGAYTIPDFAEGRYDSPLFRKIAVCFVLFIGFFYTMPQMKGAGVTLAYIFPGLPYWVGVVLVGAVITLNVALGGMKGITLVQAFQYWAKMFAISVPIFVLMAVYGNYGKQLEVNESRNSFPNTPSNTYRADSLTNTANYIVESPRYGRSTVRSMTQATVELAVTGKMFFWSNSVTQLSLAGAIPMYVGWVESDVLLDRDLEKLNIGPFVIQSHLHSGIASQFESMVETNGVVFVRDDLKRVWIVPRSKAKFLREALSHVSMPVSQRTISEKAPTDSIWLSLAETGTTNQIAVSTSMSLTVVNGWVTLNPPRIVSRAEERLKAFFGQGQHYSVSNAKLVSVLLEYTQLSGRTVIVHTNVGLTRMLGPLELNRNDWGKTMAQIEQFLATNGVALRTESANTVRAMTPEQATLWDQQAQVTTRRALPEKAPADSTWLSPFGPLTTKAAKAAAAAIEKQENGTNSNLRDSRFRLYLPPYAIESWKPSDYPFQKAKGILPFAKRVLGIDHRVSFIVPGMTNMPVSLAFQFVAQAKEWEIIRIEDWDKTFVMPPVTNGYRGPAIRALITQLKSDGIEFKRVDGNRYLPIRRSKSAEYAPVIDLLRRLNPASEFTSAGWLAKHEKPLALLYTYSLIIALVCGTAGLPHILVRFYTNPDGVAAKRTTMWVMILIGIFYVFPPVFGVMGRNLMPELYNGLTGVKGTDGIVLKLPTILREKYGVLGSVLSGITCAGAFAAFMSTFSGLLVSMTGALAHDVYGRILRPKSTPEQRLRMFKFAAVLIGAVAIVLGSFVEPLEINFMVGQAFAIAAASYFPLLFMSVWWRGMTMRGAATGMLAGGLCALAAVTLTNFSNLALDKGPMGKVFAGFAPLNDFWAHHPLLRILCEQPAIWTVPLAIGLMIVVGKLTRKDVPPDVRMKMLVLHAPEKLGLKQEYIQEHQHGH